MDSLDLFNACLKERICIAPGRMFSATDRFRHCVRLGVGGRWGDAERQALARVGQLAQGLSRTRTAMA